MIPAPTKPKFMLLDPEVMAQIGNYLLSRPMIEVEGFVFALRQATPYNPPDDKEAK